MEPGDFVDVGESGCFARDWNKSSGENDAVRPFRGRPARSISDTRVWSSDRPLAIAAVTCQLAAVDGETSAFVCQLSATNEMSVSIGAVGRDAARKGGAGSDKQASSGIALHSLRGLQTPEHSISTSGGTSPRPRLTDSFRRSSSLFSSARSAIGVGDEGEVGDDVPLSPDFRCLGVSAAGVSVGTAARRARARRDGEDAFCF